jgi:lysophospholipase L1-like esterase
VNKSGDWNHGVLINALGFRGPEVSAPKPTGSVRVVCLGDSRTFGVWASLGEFRFDNDYPAVLRAIAAGEAGGERLEVVNAGVLGYTSAHGLAQLQTQLLQLHPDVITVAFGINDLSLAFNPAFAAHEPQDWFARELFYFASHSYWFLLGKAAYDTREALHAPLWSERWVDAEGYRYNLHRFAEIGREHAIRVLFVSLALRPIEMGENVPAFPGQHDATKPMFGVKNLEDLYRLDQIYRYLLHEVTREEAVPVADAFLAFSERHEPLFGQYDLVHCNAAGARVIAETIRRKLLELGWFPSLGTVSDRPGPS